MSRKAKPLKVESPHGASSSSRKMTNPSDSKSSSRKIPRAPSEFDKITLSLHHTWTVAIDELVDKGIFPSRTAAIQFMLYPAMIREFKRIKFEVISELKKPEIKGRKFRVKPSVVKKG